MLTVYLNYPVQRIFIHRNSKCEEIEKREKPNQRKVNIHSNNINNELERFNEHPFSSNAEINDMWVTVCFEDEASEIDVINKIKKILCRRYPRFCNAEIGWHSCLN